MPPVAGSSWKFPLLERLVILTSQSVEVTPGVTTFRQKLEGAATEFTVFRLAAVCTPFM